VIGAGYWGYRDDMAVRNNNTLTPTLFRFFTDSSHGVCNLKADEADHTTPDHLSETPQHVSAFSVAARSVDWGPISGPHDWNTPAEWEWDQFYWKGTCSIGWGQFGMSNQVVGLAHSILCRKLDPAVFTGNRAATLTMPNSTRRMSRSAGGTTQWAPSGNTILECGNNEYVSGSSENVDNHFHGIRCATAVGLHNTGCNTRVFDNGDSTGATDHPDWDPGFFKGECAATEYMAGVSINTSTSRPHSLLCCPR
jgi:hypothetical protein